MSNPYILMWLQAPLQSWGYDSRYGRKGTLHFPTKSGVLGLVCAAMGYGGPQCEFLDTLCALDMQVLAYPSTKNAQGQPSCEPVLQDFQMLGSAYNEKDPWQNLLIPKTSEGKKSIGGGAKMTYRYYLQDMAFGVLLEVPQSMAKSIAEGLMAPVWDLSLGRKSCAPVEIIYQGTFAQASQALQKAQELAYDKGRSQAFKVEQGAKDGDEVLTLNDVPIQFGENKRYRDRQVTVTYCKPS